MLPSWDSAGREGGICIGNPRCLINAVVLQHGNWPAARRRATGSLPHDVDAAFPLQSSVQQQHYCHGLIIHLIYYTKLDFQLWHARPRQQQFW